MSFITTVSGKLFDPLNPEENLIDIDDIAHALSLICRYNGHTRFFYSVAQHSLACAKEAEQRELGKDIILGCLLHDASEAYLSDVTRPVKENLPYYLDIEGILQNMIWKYFIRSELSSDDRKVIFEIDDAMLSMEFYQLMPHKLNSDYKKLTREVACKLQGTSEVKQEFIDYFYKYMSKSTS